MGVDFTITVGNMLTMGGVAVAAISAFFYQRSQIDKKADQKDLAELRLEIARDYVSGAHLKDVEARMTAGIETLAHEIRGLRTDLLALYKNRSNRGGV